MSLPHMVEPTDPDERALAIKICRANAHLDPDTGRPNQETSERFWKEVGPDLSYSKWIWMWNNGQAEWNPEHSNNGGESRG